MKIKSIIESALDTILFDEDEIGPVLQARYLPSQNSPLALIIGDNASGKSLLRRIISGQCNRSSPKIEPIAVSMQGRCEAGIMRAFVYGAEDWDSTGKISASTVENGIKTSKAREGPHIVFWDEPDVGMSDNAAAGLGVEIVKYTKEPSQKLEGLFVVTHRRALVQYLLPAAPHIIFMGPNPPENIEDWLKLPLTPRSPVEIDEANFSLYKRVQAALNKNKK